MDSRLGLTVTDRTIHLTDCSTRLFCGCREILEKHVQKIGMTVEQLHMELFGLVTAGKRLDVRVSLSLEFDFAEPLGPELTVYFSRKTNSLYLLRRLSCNMVKSKRLMRLAHPEADDLIKLTTVVDYEGNKGTAFESLKNIGKKVDKYQLKLYWVMDSATLKKTVEDLLRPAPVEQESMV